MTDIRQIRLDEAPSLRVPAQGYSVQSGSLLGDLRQQVFGFQGLMNLVFYDTENTLVARCVHALSGNEDRLVLDPPIPQESPMEQAFKREKAGFEQQLPALLARYDGQYVAVHNGRVVAADRDRIRLVRRFFGEYGDVPVFIGYVSRRRRRSRVVTPLRRR